MLPSYFRLSCVAIASWGVAVSGVFADDAAKEKLKQAADTLTGASALQYKVVSMARGQMAAFSPVVRSEVFMLRTGEGADRTTLVRQWADMSAISVSRQTDLGLSTDARRAKVETTGTGVWLGRRRDG